MIVDASGVRDARHHLPEEDGNGNRRHARMEFLGLRRLVSEGLHREVKHNLVAATMSLFRDVNRVRVIRQDRDGQGIRQCKNRVRGRAIAAQIVEDDSQAGCTFQLGLAWGARRSRAGGHRGDDLHGICNHSRASKIELQKGPGGSSCVARQMVCGSDTVQRLNEPGKRFTAREIGRTWRQHDDELIGATGVSADKLQMGSDISWLFGEKRGSMRHFAGDGVNSGRRETLFLTGFAPPRKQGRGKEDNEKKVDARTTEVFLVERRR